jgi:DNA-binding MarR family transcriptional regulator
MRIVRNKSTHDNSHGIVDLIRRFSTAAVLFHQVLAERLGLGATDHKCLDVVRERGAITGSDLASITGLTTGAVTGVVARLEQAGYLNRQSDPHDGRKQILQPARERSHEMRQVFEPLHADVAAMLERFDNLQLTTIAEFLSGATELVHRQTALLRSDLLRADLPQPGHHSQSRSKRTSHR